MTNDLTARAAFTLQTDQIAPDGAGALPIFHTVPAPGAYPSKITLPDGTEKLATLLIDDLAYQRIQAAFSEASQNPAFAGLLVDREHLSELPAGDSTAAAWAKTMLRRDDGLWTGWELTDLGQQLIPTRRFKFRSPVFDLERVQGTQDKWRPVRLVSIALTNVPHFKTLTPAAMNSEHGAREEGPAMDALIARIRARLQKPDADEQQLIAAFDAALTAGETATTENATLKARVQDFEKKEREAEADTFVKEHGGKVADAAKLRARFLADPAGTRETIALLKPADRTSDQPRSLGREQAEQTPATPDAVARMREQTAAVDTAMLKYRCSTRAQAIEFAQRDNPQLFK